MGVLTASELSLIRNRCAERPTVVTTLTKAQMNAAAQACEDFLTTNAAAIATAIDTAISPGTMNAAGKKKLFAEVVEAKYQRDK